jgi:hypothetical protein
MGIPLYSFGPSYNLPLPLPTFQWAGAAVVGISFIMMTYFASHRTGPTAVRYPRREMTALGWLPHAGGLRAVTGVIGVLCLLAVVVTGLFGPAQPDRNIAVYLTWVYFWAGMAVLTGLVGPVWDAINPFRALNALITRIRLRGTPALPAPAGTEADPLAAVGVWPAVGLFFLFGLFDVTGVITSWPWLIAVLALAYTVFTLVGMQRYGERPWLAHVEFFSVLFSLLRRFAPIDFRGSRIYLRPIGAGLLDPLEAGWDWVLFVILMLSTLAFDAIMSTSVWDNVVKVAGPYWTPLGPVGKQALLGAGFVGLTLIFLVAFLVCMQLVIYFGTIKVDGLSTATVFALTLVPIAFVYNAAHNYANLVVQSQRMIPLLADPLGRGWRLLPTEGYQPSVLLASAWLVWYVQVVLIVSGHVIAMYLAHLRAGERFRAAQSVLLSQYPILVLMVLYTMTSLWILAQQVTH